MFSIARPINGRMISGVCTALAQRFSTSPKKIRMIFLPSCVLPGPQFLLYIALTLLLPSEGRARMA
ncbi:PspC domain-containing protein [Streptomyces antimycoticus]|uniref:PspC domain-containing protein n=1 Tax=Streptomyces antimycoticus TaxID=68175 RepID=UPI0037D7ED9A